MPNWREEYLSSLQDVEIKNPVNMELVQACTPPLYPALPCLVVVVDKRQARRWQIG